MEELSAAGGRERRGGEGRSPPQWAAVAGLETQGVGPEREDKGHTNHR